MQCRLGQVDEECDPEMVGVLASAGYECVALFRKASLHWPAGLLSFWQGAALHSPYFGAIRPKTVSNTRFKKLHNAFENASNCHKMYLECWGWKGRGRAKHHTLSEAACAFVARI